MTGNSEAADRRHAAAVSITEVDGVRVIAFVRGELGELNTDQALLWFSRELLPATAGRVRVVLDLAGLPTLDSSALGPLVQKLRECRQAGGALVLTGVTSPALREVLALTRFDRVFTIAADAAAAVAAARA